MKIKEGSYQENFLEVLEEMDKITSVDSLVRNGDRIKIECMREGGHLKDWKIYSNLKAKTRPISSGTTYARFKKTLNSLKEEETLFHNPSFKVLYHLDTDLERDWKGDISSNWIEIDTSGIYEQKENSLCIPIHHAKFTEDEFAIMTQTGIAFYCESTDVYYPITEVALTSAKQAFGIGKALNLGDAIIIAERIGYMSELKAISRKKNDRIRPIISIIGNRYQLTPQTDFFEIVLSNVATKFGLFEIERWSVDDDKSSLTLLYSTFGDFDFELSISMGDTSIHPFAAELSVVFDGKRLVIKKNTITHNEIFTPDMAEELFEGIQDEMDQFTSAYQEMKNKNIVFHPTWVTGIHRVLGKKRVANLPKLPKGEMNAAELWNGLIKIRYVELPIRQKTDLDKQFYNLFKQIKEEF